MFPPRPLSKIIGQVAKGIMLEARQNMKNMHNKPIRKVKSKKSLLFKIFK